MYTIFEVKSKHKNKKIYFLNFQQNKFKNVIFMLRFLNFKYILLFKKHFTEIKKKM